MAVTLYAWHLKLTGSLERNVPTHKFFVVLGEQTPLTQEPASFEDQKRHSVPLDQDISHGLVQGTRIASIT